MNVTFPKQDDMSGFAEMSTIIRNGLVFHFSTNYPDCFAIEDYMAEWHPLTGPIQMSELIHYGTNEYGFWYPALLDGLACYVRHEPTDGNSPIKLQFMRVEADMLQFGWTRQQVVV